MVSPAIFAIFAYKNQIHENVIMVENESHISLIADYYSRHYEELLAFVSKRMKYDQVAEDIVQDVFVNLMKMDVITSVTLPSLVYTIARNLILDYWRHKQHVEKYEQKVICDNGMGATQRYEVESVYAAREINEILERGIARLTDKQQVVYRMNVFEGKQVKDISEELGINYKTIENRLGTARKEVRGYMRRIMA